MHHEIGIVIPCYNEESRLPIDVIVNYSKKYIFVLVDDGSTDKTKEKINSIRSQSIHTLILNKNVGKAEAIRAGINFINENNAFENIQWVGYLDADLATPLEEVELLFKFKEIFYPNAIAVWGSRWSRLGGEIARKNSRHYSGRIFATLAFIITGIKTYDSQCGAKFFHKTIINSFITESFLTRWLFDIEIYFRILEKEPSRIINIVEYPLSKWTDIEGSKVNLTEMLFKITPQLLKIRRKYVKKSK